MLATKTAIETRTPSSSVFTTATELESNQKATVQIAERPGIELL
ncbi:MAG: hypothetical protein AAF196_00315 [Planctomycetota bacterium]